MIDHALDLRPFLVCTFCPSLSQLMVEVIVSKKICNEFFWPLRQLRGRLPMPVIPVPFIVDRTGLTTTRAVADALSTRLT